MTIKAPIRQEMFAVPGILSKIWIKFFAQVEDEINTSSSEETGVLNAPNSISSTIEDEAGVSVATVPSQASTNTSQINTDDILTLYWMGV